MKQNSCSMCGMFIKQLRCEKGWTQAELANRLSVTDKAVSRWETGKGYPEVTIIPELAKILDVTIVLTLSVDFIVSWKMEVLDFYPRFLWWFCH